jgi:hypothetical protein
MLYSGLACTYGLYEVKEKVLMPKDSAKSTGFTIKPKQGQMACIKTSDATISHTGKTQRLQ